MSKQPDARDDLIEDLYRSLMIMKGLYEGAIWQSSYLLRHKDEIDEPSEEFHPTRIIGVINFNEFDIANLDGVESKYRAYKAARREKSR